MSYTTKLHMAWILVVILLTSLGFAEVPRLVNYQGYLSDAAGTPVTDTVSMTFTIYDAETDGNSMWTETQSNVEVIEGGFSIMLGSVTTLIDTVFNDSVRYLGIQVESDPELEPRTRLTTSPYAFRVSNIDGAEGGLIKGAIRLNAGAGGGDVGIAQNKYGGVNTLEFTTVDEAGNQASRLVIRGGNDSADVEFLHGASGSEDVTLYIDGGVEGNVGIGTSTPGHKLHVDGTVRMSGFKLPTGAADGYVLTSNASGNGTWQLPGSGWRDDETSVVLRSPVDSVGIGTPWPAAKLHVDGDLLVADKATIGDDHTNTGISSFVAGENNESTGDYAMVGGYKDTASGYASVISGGTHNNATGYESTVCGGGANSADTNFACVGGGTQNTASGYAATVPGGRGNVASGTYSIAIGEYAVASGKHSFAAGRSPISSHDGSFVWSDGQITTNFESTAENQFLIRAAGGVGINTNSPTSALEVEGNVEADGFTINGVPVASSSDTYWSENNGNIYYNSGHVGIGTMNCESAKLTIKGSGKLLEGRNSSDQIVFEIGEGLDYAETFPISQNNVSPGMVMSIDLNNYGCLAVSQKAYDCKVAGIVAGANGLGSGIRLGSSAKIAGDHAIALAGRVYCYVDTQYGDIKPGDLLTTSPTPGHAMVVRDHAKAQGAILGKAMEALSGGGKGLILVLVTLQ